MKNKKSEAKPKNKSPNKRGRPSVRKPKKPPTSEDIRQELITILRELGMYSDAFLYLIESCAQLVVLRNRAYDALRDSELIVREYSREGEERLKAHPIYPVYLEFNKELRQVLNDMKMNIRSSSFGEGDQLDTLNAKIMELLHT